MVNKNIMLHKIPGYRVPTAARRHMVGGTPNTDLLPVLPTRARDTEERGKIH